MHTVLLALALAALQPIELEVDLREAPRRLVHARMVIPARPGPLALVYPKWIQGTHAPDGPLEDVVGLRITAGGKTLPWTRDEVDLYAVRIQVPTGASRVEVALDHAPPQGFTTNLAVFSWSSAILYPQGDAAGEVQVRPTMILPAGWKWGSALIPASDQEGRIAFRPVSLETLADSPVLAGRHLRRYPVGPTTGPPHQVVVAAETEEGTGMPPEWKERFDRLVAEAAALFGPRHYRRYDFLLALSGHVKHGGLEHLESSDIRLPERFLRGAEAMWRGWLPPHEYVHSWTGKYRRPAGLVARDLQEPLRSRDLWIYEGLTHYLGFVLAARAGIYTPEEFRDALATQAEWMATRQGRRWRSVEDTATAASILEGSRSQWRSARRWLDYYWEGLLVWLEADVLIRETFGGTRSLDDFCRAFFGGAAAGAPEVRPYGVADVVAAMNAVAPRDWGAFFAERLASVVPSVPLGGIERAGWRLGHGGRPGPYYASYQADQKLIDLRGSLGLLLGTEGASIVDVVPGSPADEAGLSPGGRLAAVNGRRFEPEVLAEAIAATPASGKVELLVEDADFFRAYPVAWRGGPRFPVLERDPARPDLLSAIAAPRAGR